jgi:hypothetical protein
MGDEDLYTPAEVFKLKRKWQIALRRYVLEQQACPAYAKYFGLPISLFREWIEIQFDSTTTWENFSQGWQFDHIVPVAYFNFKNKRDLELCWNFTNIRIEKMNLNPNRGHRVDVIAAKAYFNELFAKTGYALCQEMIQKIESIELSQISSNNNVEQFIIRHFDTLDELSKFSESDFQRVNLGMSIQDLILEAKMFARFGK